MDLIDDRQVAKLLGYPKTAGGFKAAREFLARAPRNLYPLDDRHPAVYDADEVRRVLDEYPARRGNFATGEERKAQTSKNRTN